MIKLNLLAKDHTKRDKRDRLELITALIEAPGFDPLYRSKLIEFPPHHPAYGWRCVVENCERVRRQDGGLCQAHQDGWGQAQAAGISRADFLASAPPCQPQEGIAPARCLVCPGRTAVRRDTPLCKSHESRWGCAGRPRGTALEGWLATQIAFPGFGECLVEICPEPASSKMGLCVTHQARYIRAGRPGGAYALRAKRPDLEDQIRCADWGAFKKWCAMTDPVHRIGLVNLKGLHPLVEAEIQWGLNRHAQLKHRSVWDVNSIQRLANQCRASKLTSLVEFTAAGCPGIVCQNQTYTAQVRMMSLEIVNGLRCIYYSPADTKDAGYIETDQFGRRFVNAQSYFDLTRVSQRWLRDLLWEHLAEQLRSPQCPRSRGPFDQTRRACVELSAFLEMDAPGGGHDPRLLQIEHAQRFVADQRHRLRHGMTSLGMVRSDGKQSFVTEVTTQAVSNYSRRIMFWALESGYADEIGLDRGFTTAFPNAGKKPKGTRNPFSDEVARALAAEDNLRELEKLDPNDRGLRDVWEAIVYTGRRCSETLTLKLDCIGYYRGLPMLWHDQTKVGNYNEGIRIPDYLFERIDVRRRKTLLRFENRHGRVPIAAERAQIALFPTNVRNPQEENSISYGHFSSCFKIWVDGLDLGSCVAHQARHTLATKLLGAGASLAHIRRYLGQVSDRMAERYAKVAHSDLDDILSAVWVAGPGSANPGELLSGNGATPLTQQEALSLALDLSRRSTPSEGGICTFQPVVNGEACPWNLNCTDCDKFVLSGADLLYWRRKQEQWRSMAERAPTDEAADYLHAVFAPTARAIEGLERALAGLGLLDEALTLDLRRPQDYFQRVWATNFRATDLYALAD